MNRKEPVGKIYNERIKEILEKENILTTEDKVAKFLDRVEKEIQVSIQGKVYNRRSETYQLDEHGQHDIITGELPDTVWDSSVAKENEKRSLIKIKSNKRFKYDLDHKAKEIFSKCVEILSSGVPMDEDLLIRKLARFKIVNDGFKVVDEGTEKAVLREIVKDLVTKGYLFRKELK